MQLVETAPFSRKGLVLAGGLVALVAAAMLIAWGVRHVGHPAALTRAAARLDDLPARPADIEAHATLGRSLLQPDQARLRNAAVPLAAGPVIAARPFVFTGSDEDRALARQCLATAVLYEAGDDAEGQAAVAQVVLNRVRHPAFPATVCGVVYQGAQRSTGCQFTFSCDGSLRRQMPDAAWRRARDVADRALAGEVDNAVGLATHYHTNWVYPYWSPQLSKLAQVGTHLFFGWPGSWGGAQAFQRRYRGQEAVVAGAPAIAGPATPNLTPVEDLTMPRLPGLPLPPAQLPAGVSRAALYGNKLRLVRPDERAFGLLAPSDAAAAKLVEAAQALCAKPGPCQVSAWSNEDDIPGEYPIPDGARSTMVFDFTRDGAGGKASQRFDCARFPGKDAKSCL